jgi:DNA-binding CsgD family transcriptional regulator
MQMLTPDSQLIPLSAEERRVLTLSAAGLVTAEVAEALGMSTATVRGYLASAICKLGARSKLEAVSIALRTGRIDLCPGCS